MLSKQINDKHGINEYMLIQQNVSHYNHQPYIAVLSFNLYKAHRNWL